jgi:hypothetical protein
VWSKWKIVARDIIVDFKDMGPKRILDMHPKLMSLQYPLLFPYREDEFTLEIPYRRGCTDNCKRKNVTMLEYYVYYLFQRPDESMMLLTAGRLSMQYWVATYYLFQWPDESMMLLTAGRLSMQYWIDVYTCIEQNRLTGIRQNQGKLRTELYSGLHDALERGDTEPKHVGSRIYLPSSHTGSPWYMAQNLQNAMVVCHWVGYPNLFVTITYNAKWSEIQYMLDASRVK